MMKAMRLGPLVVGLALAVMPGVAAAQGRSGDRPPQGQRGQAEPRGQGQEPRGQGQGGPDRDRAPGPPAARASGQGPGQAQGRPSAAGRAPRGQARGSARVAPGQLRRGLDRLPEDVRGLARGERVAGRMVAGAAARARLRGVEAADVDVRVDAERVRILNRRGDTLLDLDDERARRLGAWDVRRLGDQRANANAPAFCESGAGHPVWGRQWCLDKGFGLGGRNDHIWGRSEIDDVVFRRRTDTGVMDRGTLVDVLGDVVLGRLALHALTLGLTEPLSGTWTADDGAPRILRLQSGDVQVAEFVDTDRDDRADLLFIVTPVWR